MSVLFEFPKNRTEFFLNFVCNSPVSTVYSTHWVNHMTCRTHAAVGAELLLDQTIDKY